MSSSYETFKGLWRASANEAVPYTDDFPECLLVLPELLDGSIVQGNATVLSMSFKWISDTQMEVIVRDNGEGIKNERRLLQWAAAKSVSTIHKNGHGLKKSFTKFMRDFDSANWTIQYRKKNRNIQTISSPFLGPDTKVEENEHDEQSLMPSGTCIRFVCDTSVLGSKYSEYPKNLLNGIREIITTRYSEEILNRVDFQIELQRGAVSIKTSSKEDEWHSFEWHIQQRIPGQVLKKMEISSQIPGGEWIYREYYLHLNGATAYDLKSDELFPVYGRKNQKTSRVHTYVDNRAIEAIPFYRILGRDTSHNDENGLFGFWYFTPNSPEDFDKMPQPATTKVSFYENDPIFKDLLKKLYDSRREEMNAQEEKRQAKLKADRDVAAAAAKKAEEERKKMEQESIKDTFNRLNTNDGGNQPVYNVVVPNPKPPAPKPPTPTVAETSEKVFFQKLKKLYERLKEIDFKDELEYADTTADKTLEKGFKALDTVMKTLSER